MLHTCHIGNVCSCISYNRLGFRAEGDLRSRVAVRNRRNRNGPGYLPAAKEGNLLFPANFTSIRRGFPDYPSLAEGDEIADESSGCRGPACEERRHEVPLDNILEK